MNKVGDNTLEALTSYFVKELESVVGIREAKLFFDRISEEVLGYAKTDRILNKSIRLSESQILDVLYKIKELKKGRPLSYVIGFQHFFGLSIPVAEGVLIPRPETEELVDWVLEESRTKISLLDVCSGSGCISLALKSKRPTWQIKGLDVSPEAVNQSKSNARLLGLACEFSLLDILKSESIGKEEYDIIVSNPPYVLNSEQVGMQSSVHDFEPHVALFVTDDDPLLFYRKIGVLAFSALKMKGSWFFEINERFGKEVSELLISLGFSKVELQQDLQGKDRMVKAIK